jgi:hypothetical protein
MIAETDLRLAAFPIPDASAYSSAQAHPVMRQPAEVSFRVTVSIAFSDIDFPLSVHEKLTACTTYEGEGAAGSVTA